MSLAAIILLAIALGTDCLVVSFSQGLIYKTDKVRNALLLAVSMGFFQWLMPFIGYFLTNSVFSSIEPFAKWIVFVIFFALGTKLIVESFERSEETTICMNWKCLISMGIATSIDALASGVSIKLSGTPLIFSTLMIGLMSFLMSLFGFSLANFFKKIPSNLLEIFGGLILIGLAVKEIV